MKNIILFIGLIGVLIFSSCEKRDWPSPDIDLTPVYSIVNIKGAKAPYRLDVYREEPLLIEFVNENILKPPYKTSEYSDQSTADKYIVSFTAHEQTKTEAGKDTTVVTEYYIEVDKVTKNGAMMKIVFDVENNADTINYVVDIKETKQYI